MQIAQIVLAHPTIRASSYKLGSTSGLKDVDDEVGSMTRPSCESFYLWPLIRSHRVLGVFPFG